MKKIWIILIPIAIIVTTFVVISSLQRTINIHTNTEEQKSRDIILPNDISSKQRRHDITYAYELWNEQYVKKIKGQPT